MSQPKLDRRIDRLKIQALEIGLTKDQVREFGKLTRTETWEKAIAFRDATTRDLRQWKELDVDNVIHGSVELPHSQNLSDWINFPQLIALILASVGFFMLVVPMLRGIPSPLPIKITIQIGAAK